MRVLLHGSFLVLLVALAGCRPEAPRTGGEAVRLVPAALPSAVSDDDRETFRRVMAYAREHALHERPIGEIMQRVGEQFVGTPYRAGLLDEPPEERLVLRFDGFDCVLFVETVLAMARGIARQDYRFDTFARHIEEQRYRDGRMNGYCSRLHYFSEWIADNEARGIVRNITAELGGEPLEKQLNFMSRHRDSYPRFAADDSLFQGIRAMEADLADLALYYIPQDRIREVYPALEPGDIVALATSLEGLDVTHTGLVYRDARGRTGLLHASTSGAVKVSPDLQTYVENNTIQVGIVVARPLAPRG
ncbi:MAG: DUF1460 domain-containing protein [Bacteroidetes bacterium]|nr:MAG: DUF1460 domain-containing protein [Bacteroidota bacterium]